MPGFTLLRGELDRSWLHRAGGVFVTNHFPFSCCEYVNMLMNNTTSFLFEEYILLVIVNQGKKQDKSKTLVIRGGCPRDRSANLCDDHRCANFYDDRFPPQYVTYYG